MTDSCLFDRLICSVFFFFSVIRHKPRVILNVAHSLISHLSPFLRQIDYALDWMHVEAGRAVYRYNLRKKRLRETSARSKHHVLRT